MSQRLIILASADYLPDDSCDILALTLPAMALLKTKKRSFLVLEDFLPHQDVYKNTHEFSQKVAVWLQSCDKLCLQTLNIERAFSSTGFWMLHRLSDLNYIHHFIDAISAKYQNVELYASSQIPEAPVPNVDFGSLNMPSFGMGLAHVLWFIKAGFPSLTVHVTGASNKEAYSQKIGGEPLLSTLKRLPNILKRRTKLIISKFSNALHKKIGRVWVVQQGYDVEVLKHHNPQWDFILVRNDEINEANHTSESKVKELDDSIIKISEVFFNEHLPRYYNWLNIWLEQYYRKIVLKLNSYEKALEERMRINKPAALLYSIGAEDALEEVLCRVANRLLIPVFFFKHGGIAEQFLLPSILDPYLEHNASLQRTQFIHSEEEVSAYAKLSSVNTVVSGPLSRTQLNYKKNPQQKNILYSLGPPAHFSFKELQKVISDHERFTFMCDLLHVCNDKKLNLSVKVHPAEWRVAWQCMQMLNDEISDSRYRAKLIAGGAIERIFSQFGLLVLDIISTRVMSMAIGIDIPIVLYLPKGSPVNQKYFADLEKRVYVVNNRHDLADILSRYQNHGLPSKYNQSFVEKYLGCFNPESAIQKVSDQVFNKKRETIC